VPSVSIHEVRDSRTRRPAHAVVIDFETEREFTTVE